MAQVANLLAFAGPMSDAAAFEARLVANRTATAALGFEARFEEGLHRGMRGVVKEHESVCYKEAASPPPSCRFLRLQLRQHMSASKALARTKAAPRNSIAPDGLAGTPVTITEGVIIGCGALLKAFDGGLVDFVIDVLPFPLLSINLGTRIRVDSGEIAILRDFILLRGSVGTRNH